MWLEPPLPSFSYMEVMPGGVTAMLKTMGLALASWLNWLSTAPHTK